MGIMFEESYGFLGLRSRMIGINLDGIFILKEDTPEREREYINPPGWIAKKYRTFMADWYDIHMAFKAR